MSCRCSPDKSGLPSNEYSGLLFFTAIKWPTKTKYNRMMTEEQYLLISDFLEKRSLHLMENENKESTHARFPRQNYIDYNPHEASPKFYVVATNIFKGIIFDKNYLADIASKNPEYFQTGDARDVLHGIVQYDENFKFLYERRICHFASLLSKAHAYVIKIDGENIYPEILRIDLFRMLKKSKKDPNKYDFVGGLFHGFKHFGINGVNLSTRNEMVELYHTLRIISFAIDAFFKSKRTQTSKGFDSIVKFNDEADLHFCFHENKETKTFFIITIIYKGKK